MTAPVLTLDNDEVLKVVQAVEDALGNDVRPIWREFAAYMRTTVDQMFRTLRHGGSGRGVAWPYFADQYTRKTDGVTVPAWGGVPKIHGGGFVLGRRRPSGSRVAQGDSVMQDGGTMRARALLVLSMQADRFTMGPQGVNYARYQNARRPWAFFELPRDVNALFGIAVDRLRKALGSHGI